MKAIITLGILVLSLAGSQATFGQMTAYANIYAEVIAPAYIEKSADMTFTQLSTPGKSGSVVLNSTGHLTGGESAQAGNGTLATFSIQGSDIATFDISVPNREVTIKEGGSGALTISNFTTSVTETAASSSRCMVVKIGATLHTGENQAAGTFKDQNSFQVNFNYN